MDVGRVMFSNIWCLKFLTIMQKDCGLFYNFSLPRYRIFQNKPADLSIIWLRHQAKWKLAKTQIALGSCSRVHSPFEDIVHCEFNAFDYATTKSSVKSYDIDMHDSTRIPIF